MEAYSGFAEVYDFLMKDIDYDGWINYIENVFQRESVKPKTILELACGTGNITNRLAKKGYDMIGVDISNEMLMFAKDKAYNLGLDVKYLNQDMRELDFRKKVDSIICLCDGFNYILEESELLDVFKRVCSILSDGGLFIFDISSYYKVSEILGNNVYGENFEDVSYIWHNYFDEESNICELDLTIFKREKGLFSRHQECHFQRAYRREEICDLLRMAEFKNIVAYKSFSFEQFNQNDERICFICKK